MNNKKNIKDSWFKQTHSIVTDLINTGSISSRDVKGELIEGMLDGFKIRFKWEISSWLNPDGDIESRVRYDLYIDDKSWIVNGDLSEDQLPELRALYEIKNSISKHAMQEVDKSHIAKWINQRTKNQQINDK